MRYKTTNVCATHIDFDIDAKGHVHNVQFSGGCRGNRQAVAKLVEGMHKDEVIRRLKGIDCRMGTSCPDQLAKALSEN